MSKASLHDPISIATPFGEVVLSVNARDDGDDGHTVSAHLGDHWAYAWAGTGDVRATLKKARTEVARDEAVLRRLKLAHWRTESADSTDKDNNHGAYPNGITPSHRIADISNEHTDRVFIAGRMMAKRTMGKVFFATLRDASGAIQIYVSKEVRGAAYTRDKWLDVGDVVAVGGAPFTTESGELTIAVDDMVLVSKCLHPLPEKYHGLQDTEMKYRQRYVDLIASDHNPGNARARFEMRSAVIRHIRRAFENAGFMEVETPMMHPIPGGANAKPFITHHNALDRTLYLRIAPELYLKRLIVGGYDKVFEINRNFRNEGLSTRHNPEFTMLEFYWAYAREANLMPFTETLLSDLAKAVLGTTRITYQGAVIDFTPPFARLSMHEAVLRQHASLTRDDLGDTDALRRYAATLDIAIPERASAGEAVAALFEETVEETLIQPTFITGYPFEISPLARRNDANPMLTDRFELFIGGREIANGFSELNDPDDQKARFQAQLAAHAAGDDEAMHYDADYIRALEYGMPPTAGEGIGIDRLVMLLTDAPSIRDVILFPQLKDAYNATKA